MSFLPDALGYHELETMSILLPILTPNDSDDYIQVLSFNEDNFRLLYKPHPRSDTEDLYYMVEYVSTITGIDASIWLQITPKSIPFELFAMTGEFNDNSTTSTDCQLFLTSTSTVALALYECGITSDNVEAYFGNEGAEETLRAWYGDSGIIDYYKLILSW